jgi:hypothetical protein
MCAMESFHEKLLMFKVRVEDLGISFKCIGMLKQIEADCKTLVISTNRISQIINDS